MLAEYSGSLQTKSGYATHYTNDYLWTPVGDPYGFKMYNRYMYKNLGEKKVMSTSRFENNEPIEMVDDNDTPMFHTSQLTLYMNCSQPVLLHLVTSAFTL